MLQGGSVSVTDLRVVDDRPQHERAQEYGIHVTNTARECRIVGNDVRRAGTEADIRVDPPADDVRPSTIVRDNVGDGIASGSVVLQSGSDPAARVEGVTVQRDLNLKVRAATTRGPAEETTFAWDAYPEWNGDTDQWDLVFEWVTDPLENMEVEYVVDQPLANLGRVSKQIDHY